MTQMLTSPDGSPASRFAFGTMQFGDKADEAQSSAMFTACRDAGINHFDTAYVYTDGKSEEILGRLVQKEREKLLIATKVGYAGGATPGNLHSQFETCRKRLGLEMVDILYLHRFDPETDLRRTLEFFAAEKQAGHFRYLGLSNFAAWQVMKAQAIGVDFGLRVDILQPMYSLLKRQAEVEILPMCSAEGIAIAPYSPLAGGLLSGKYARGETGRLTENKRYAARYGQSWMHDAARGLNDIAAVIGIPPATLAAAWAARHPSAPCPILSARNTEQLAPSLAAMKFHMDDTLYNQIGNLSPKPAPATDRLEEA